LGRRGRRGGQGGGIDTAPAGDGGGREKPTPSTPGSDKSAGRGCRACRDWPRSAHAHPPRVVPPLAAPAAAVGICPCPTAAGGGGGLAQLPLKAARRINRRCPLKKDSFRAVWSGTAAAMARYWTPWALEVSSRRALRTTPPCRPAGAPRPLLRAPWAARSTDADVGAAASCFWWSSCHSLQCVPYSACSCLALLTCGPLSLLRFPSLRCQIGEMATKRPRRAEFPRGRTHRALRCAQALLPHSSKRVHPVQNRPLPLY